MPIAEDIITGNVNFAGMTSKTVSIDRVDYVITNKENISKYLVWSKDISTGIVTFTCNNFKIVGQDGEKHLLNIQGLSNSVYDGNLDNEITLVSGQFNYAYGMGGNDTLINKGSTQSGLLGGAGNDILTSETSADYTTIDGGDDIDTININSRIYSTCTGGKGNDIFNINCSTGDSSTTSGAGYFIAEIWEIRLMQQVVIL